jgi:branched-subunit amino acid transport protein
MKSVPITSRHLVFIWSVAVIAAIIFPKCLQIHWSNWAATTALAVLGALAAALVLWGHELAKQRNPIARSS